MTREPSIHITKSDLRKVLKTLGIKEEYFVIEIMKRSKTYSLNSRNVVVTNDKLEKKVNKIVQSSRKDADLFAQLVYAIRKSKKHRGISHMKPGSKDWDILKEVAASALDFCNEFDLKRRDGFIEYIKIGMDKMKKFSLLKFKALNENISESYEAKLEINKDPEPDITESMYKVFFQTIMEETGIPDESRDIPERYVWFVRAKEEAKKMDIDPILYIEAQFAGLDFANSIPHPTQLVGMKARDRVMRYAYKKLKNG